jgi:phospholipid/cholesterol/gamma-HCH transport system permease protein
VTRIALKNPAVPAMPVAVIQFLGSAVIEIVRDAGDFTLFCGRSFASLPKTRKLPRRILRAVYEQGAVCLPVIAIVGVFTGLVLGLQGYHVLSRFGSEGLLGTLVSLSLVREMAPVLAALMLVGQAGSAFAAELGIQRNTEQIAALDTMGINSLGYLVAPRLVAALIVFPAQAALFTVVGLWGGSLSGSVLLGVDPGVYWSAVERAVEYRDLRECFTKAATFGLLTTSICAYMGFNAGRNSSDAGARAVSASTTRAVVFSSISVLAADYAISSFFV